MKYQNLHTHTAYCDGELTAEEMVEAAIAKGGGSVGFSEHSHVYFEISKYAMATSDIPLYVNEINALKKKYAGQIEIYLGMERDYFTQTVPEGLDYVIGSVHFIWHAGKHITIDDSYENLKHNTDEYFGGDIYAVIERYYETVAEVAKKTKADIIGHFDTITKFNEGGRLFDETNPRYVKAASAAMDSILESCKTFEMSSGAMYRNGRTVQYPSTALLRELKQRGGEIVLTSDSHDAGSLYYKFDEMRDIARRCGFEHIKRLTAGGFIDEKI